MKKSEKYSLAVRAVIESNLDILEKMDVLAVLFDARDSAILSEQFEAKRKAEAEAKEAAKQEGTENG